MFSRVKSILAYEPRTRLKDPAKPSGTRRVADFQERDGGVGDVGGHFRRGRFNFLPWREAKRLRRCMTNRALSNRACHEGENEELHRVTPVQQGVVAEEKREARRGRSQRRGSTWYKRRGVGVWKQGGRGMAPEEFQSPLFSGRSFSNLRAVALNSSKYLSSAFD